MATPSHGSHTLTFLNFIFRLFKMESLYSCKALSADSTSPNTTSLLTTSQPSPGSHTHTVTAITRVTSSHIYKLQPSPESHPHTYNTKRHHTCRPHTQHTQDHIHTYSHTGYARSHDHSRKDYIVTLSNNNQYPAGQPWHNLQPLTTHNQSATTHPNPFE